MINFTDIDNLEGDILTIRYVPLSHFDNLSNILFDKNPKKHDLDKIIQSICDYGFIDPPKWDTSLNGGRGGFVYGNGRIEGLVQLLTRLKKEGSSPPRGIGCSPSGEWCIPVKFGVDAKSEAIAQRLAIDHNNLTMSGGDFTALDMKLMWDESNYLELLKELEKQEQLPLTVDEGDLELLLQESSGGGSGTGGKGKDEIPNAEQIESRVKPGEVWRLGRHYIACADSTVEENVQKLLAYVDNRTPSMVWADPPYGIAIQDKDGRVGGSKGGGFGKGNVPGAKAYPIIVGDETTETAEKGLSFYLSAFTKAVHIWWGGNHYNTPPSPCWIVWDKKTEKGDYEGICFADAELAWTNQKSAVRVFRHLWLGAWKESEVHQARVHPTQKPVALFEWCAQKYGEENDLIIDPFLGSGMSIIAAQQMEGDGVAARPSGLRTVVGFELSPEYCEVCMRRWESLTGETGELVGHLTETVNSTSRSEKPDTAGT